MAPKYKVLARAYRPQRFADVVGQEAILRTLRNALERDHLAHAYLFTGSRGVGKTTLARLFAKAINCHKRTAEGEPCNECASCLDITAGQALDVIEIDGASNRGIDDIRQINETVGFAPSHGKYKIYIIDEVHMLTKEAFNALLKTLEEPPEKAKFFFATTEPHKVLPTIISRCQRLDLGRLPRSLIVERLALIARDLGRGVESEALELVAHAADGSLRDAQSLFDQVLCFAAGAVSTGDVQSVLGLAPQEMLFALDQAFHEARLGFAFELVEELFLKGKEFGHFLDQLIEHYRHLALVKTLGSSALQLSSPQVTRYEASARLYTQAQCLAVLDLLIKTEALMTRSVSPRVTLELALLQVLRTKNRIPVEVLVRRLAELEHALQGGAVAAPPQAPAVAPEAPAVALAAPEPRARVVTAAHDAPGAPPVPAAMPEPQTPWDVAAAPEALAAPLERAQPVAAAPETPAVRPEAVVPVARPVRTAAPEPQAPVVAAAPEAPTATPEPAASAQPAKPATLQAAPFNPFKTAEPAAPSTKHPSHYDTLMRFTAVELEGTLKL